MDATDDPHVIHGTLDATIAMVLALIDALPPRVRPMLEPLHEARAQRLRDLFGDLPYRDQYFESFDAVTDRFREAYTKPEDATPRE